MGISFEVPNLACLRSQQILLNSRTGSGDSGLTGLSNGTDHPPPLPVHRYPSWEDRIYQVASEGLNDHTNSDNGKNNNDEKRNSFLYGDELSIPVYASVQGVRLFIMILLD